MSQKGDDDNDDTFSRQKVSKEEVAPLDDDYKKVQA